MPQLPPSTGNRREPPEERHTPAVHLIGTRLVAMCKCGAILGGNRDTDTNVISLHDLLRLSVAHNSHINRRR